MSIWQKKKSIASSFFIKILVTCPPSLFPRQIKNLKTPKKQLLLSKNSITLHFSNRFYFVVSSLIPSFNINFFLISCIFIFQERTNFFLTQTDTLILGVFFLVLFFPYGVSRKSKFFFYLVWREGALT